MLIQVAGTASPWSKPEYDGQDWWTKNPYMEVPKNRQIQSYESDVNATCSGIFGAYSNGGKYGGCVSYGTDDEGIMSTLYLPKRPKPDLREHEERHAGGWLHPWPGFMKAFEEQK